MLAGNRIGMVSTMVALGMALGCGHSSSATDGGADAGGTDPATACAHYFEALYGQPCGVTPPPDEQARVEARFVTSCEGLLALPGTGTTADQIEACASAWDAAACRQDAVPIDACTFGRGSEPVGAPCNDASQCQSGSCVISTASGADGGNGSCGTCGATVARGQPCSLSGDPCEPGTACDYLSTAPTCIPPSYGDVGASCSAIQADCKTGLYCASQTKQCTAPGDAGAACDQLDACNPPLVCGGTMTPLTCQPAGGAGTPCIDDSQCAGGLGCDVANTRCATVTWVAPGQPCNGIDRCLVGLCPLQKGGAPGGSCPTVIKDGQPCTPGDASRTCDAFSQCVGGVCTLPYSTVCR